MEEENFKRGDLQLSDWQYTIIHHSPTNFMCGEKVFLKSNPKYEMIVQYVNKNEITTTTEDLKHKFISCEFSPECILQYKYIGLITYR